jgi:isoquinoline 1-oxidoreductase alpha subunit
VHVDGNAVRSCQVAIGALEGSLVVTIEALSQDRGHPVQQAWIAEMVPQCGYCQSGMIMAAAALLARNAEPTDADIDARSPISAAAAPIRDPAGDPARGTGSERSRDAVGGSSARIDPADAARAIPAFTPPRAPD